MKEVDVLGSRSLIVRTVSVDVKQRKETFNARGQIYHGVNKRIVGGDCISDFCRVSGF